MGVIVCVVVVLLSVYVVGAFLFSFVCSWVGVFFGGLFLVGVVGWFVGWVLG